MSSDGWNIRRFLNVGVLTIVLALSVAIKANAHSDDEPGTIEILGIDFDPPVVMAGQPFTVISSGYHVSHYREDPNVQDSEIFVVDNTIYLRNNSDGFQCYTTPPARPPNDEPSRHRYFVPGLPEGTYTVRIELISVCDGSVDTAEERQLTIYHNDNTPRLVELESPAPNQVVSGVGLVRGWACNIRGNGRRDTGPAMGRITYQIDDFPRGTLVYGTSRLDTEQACGDLETNTGFGSVFYWGLLGEGEHQFTLYVDDEAVTTRSFTVVAPQEGFLKGIEGGYELDDFPAPGQSVMVEWSEADQNFVIVDFQ